ncbi:MAG TPA: hypothetical protein VMT30_07470 [Candidatus Saccharimonadia bacterium]|nr:hypothetical protein [Candidatus Saccharimonadia bacterium]
MTETTAIKAVTPTASKFSGMQPGWICYAISLIGFGSAVIAAFALLLNLNLPNPSEPVNVAKFGAWIALLLGVGFFSGVCSLRLMIEKVIQNQAASRHPATPPTPEA